MRGFKRFCSTQVLLATALFAFGATSVMTPAANAQIVVNVGIQPVCSYGYYDYAPYACAPVGFYGSGYFYNGIFLGMGPWAGWGYGHGWGGHRFVNDGGGRYHGGGGFAAGRAYQRGQQAGHAQAVRQDNRGAARGNEAAHGATGRTAAGRPQASHAAAPHAAAHGGGGAPHGGGAAHGGGAVHGGGAHGGGEHK